MTAPLSIIGSWLTLFAATLEHYGIDSHEFLAEQGVDYDRQSDPTQRIPLTLMTELWDKLADRTQDPAVGLKAGQFVTPTTFSALGIALWSSCSIKDLLTCWCRYLHVFSTAANPELIETESQLIMVARLNTQPGIEESSHYAIDATLSALLHLCRQHYGSRISPLGVELTRPEPANPRDYEELLGCPVSFGHDCVRARFNRTVAEETIPGGNPTLAAATEQLVADYLQKMQPSSVLQDVRQVLFELLPRGEAKLDLVAERLHMSPRTLHRKLEEQGTNFRQQQEATRQQLAMQFMQQAHLNISEIGFLLGFSSTSNFSRAFKRWTGRTPQEYRRSSSQ